MLLLGLFEVEEFVMSVLILVPVQVLLARLKAAVGVGSTVIFFTTVSLHPLSSVTICSTL